MSGPVSIAPVTIGASITSQASVLVSTELVGVNVHRTGLIIINTDANALYIRYGYGAAPTAGNWTYRILSGETWEMTGTIYAGVIEGIWDANGSGYAEITELS